MRERKRRPRLRVIAGGGAGEDAAPNGATAPEGPSGAADRAGAAALRLHADIPLQPACDDQDALAPGYYEEQHEARHIGHNVDRLRHAIVDLAAIDLPPERLLNALSPDFDRPVIRERLVQAIDCLSSFAEAWCRDEAARPLEPVRGPGGGDESR